MPADESIPAATAGPGLSAPPPQSRSPWQRFYGAVLHRRRRWHQRRARTLPRPVVSIGNLHWGGSGKTPLVAAVASHLRDGDHAVAILSRGYGGKGKGVQLVSTGEGPLLGPRLAGDEPVLLAGAVPGVAVVVCPDRYLAGRHALERLAQPPDIFVLDDGFSHVRLHREIELLAFPAADPWAGARLIPSGRLREPLTATAGAHAVVLTDSKPPAGDQLARMLEPSGFRGPGFASDTVLLEARLESGETLAAPGPVIVVCGIARPQVFSRAVRSAGFEVVAELTLGDHHSYPEATLTSIRRLWEEHQAKAVLTTSKDLVKLLGRLDLPLAELPIEARPEPAFWDWLDHRVSGLIATR